MLCSSTGGVKASRTKKCSWPTNGLFPELWPCRVVDLLPSTLLPIFIADCFHTALCTVVAIGQGVSTHVCTEHLKAAWKRLVSATCHHMRKYFWASAACPLCTQRWRCVHALLQLFRVLLVDERGQPCTRHQPCMRRQRSLQLPSGAHTLTNTSVITPRVFTDACMTKLHMTTLLL